MEIGSEFWKQQTKMHIRDEEEIYLSGRTGLDAIIKDAIKCYGITSALLPSYCCHTMIEPFLANSISVRFYDIYVDEAGKLTAEVPIPQKDEILYIMKYFGDTNLACVGDGRMLDGWSVTVEDLTHSCFDNQYESKADYWFISYRKWFAVDGIATAGKRGGGLRPPYKGKNIDYCMLRNNAYEMKDRFMRGQVVEKKDFLNLFSEAEKLLSKDYQGYGARPDTISELFQFIDEMEQIRGKRRENADTLTRGICGIDDIKVLTYFKKKSECPLFVPVLVRNGKRDELRKYLIDKEIYCPVHWPVSKQHMGLSEKAKEIYKEELSLVCDQRYSVEDMNRIVQEINSFFKDR